MLALANLQLTGLMEAMRRGRRSSSTVISLTYLAYRFAASPHLRPPVKKLEGKRGFIDLFWKGVLLVEQKSAGPNLKQASLQQAKEQAFDYFPGLKEKDLPRYILLSDFQTFELYDCDEDDTVSFALADLPQHIEAFGFILGRQKRSFKDQDPVNIQASELIGKLHDALEASGYQGMI